MAPVVAGIGKLEHIGARDLHLPVLIARKAHPGEGDRLIEELQLIALARRAAGADCALARLQAVGPQEGAGEDQEQRECLPHQAALTRSAAFSANAMTEALIFPDGTDGITDASTTRRPPMPLTRSA